MAETAGPPPLGQAGTGTGTRRWAVARTRPPAAPIRPQSR